MDDKIYWLWLSLKEHVPVEVQLKLISVFGSPEAVYDCDNFHGKIPEKFEEELNDKSLAGAKQVMERIEAMDGYILTLEDGEYPPNLKSITVPPLVLYIRGRHIDWDGVFSLTVVGTRRCSDYGRRATDMLVRELARRGVTIVSGMARGIDAVAARAALREGGSTIAVLGSGIDVIYPREHEGLYYDIIENGMVVSEFPPGTPPLKINFPRRNRVMAGISTGMLIGQAPEKSGALITAAHGVSEGRNVYVIPSDIYDAGFAGSLKLISQGAKLVSRVEDITEDYPYMNFEERFKSEAVNRQTKKVVSLEGLSAAEIAIVEILCKKDAHIDELARISKMSSPEVNSVLVMLELNGIVKKLSGNIYGIA